ncbi:MAG: hypothetical protein VW396_06645 [Ilumatobacter sp.]
MRLLGRVSISGLGLWLVAIWLLLWNDLSIANLVSGAVVATVSGWFK